MSRLLPAACLLLSGCCCCTFPPLPVPASPSTAKESPAPTPSPKPVEVGPLEGISLEKRRAIFAEDRANHSRALDEADRRTGINTKPVGAKVTDEHFELFRRFDRQYRAELLKRHGITEEQWTAIEMQGLAEGWPQPRRGR